MRANVLPEVRHTAQEPKGGPDYAARQIGRWTSRTEGRTGGIGPPEKIVFRSLDMIANEIRIGRASIRVTDRETCYFSAVTLFVRNILNRVKRPEDGFPRIALRSGGSPIPADEEFALVTDIESTASCVTLSQMCEDSPARVETNQRGLARPTGRSVGRPVLCLA